METLPLIFGSVVSPFVRKVLITLSIKNIPYENQELIPFIDQHKQKLLELNPLGQVPVYQEGDFIIADSSVICAYLERKHPQHPIYPENAEDYAKCLWYEEYADSQIIPAIRTVFFHSLLAARFNIEPDVEAIKTALETTLPTMFTYLDQEIADKQYLAGDRFSLADISITAAFLNYEFAGHTVDATRWKNLARYIDSMFKEKYIAESSVQARARFLK